MPENPYHNWMRENFDKFLLCLLFVFMALMVMAQKGADRELVGWARETASAILGALLGLITGLKVGALRQPQQPPNNDHPHDQGGS